jgi:hypothetical protein
LFLDVRSWSQRLRSLRLSKIFCFINRGHSLVLSGLVYSGVVFQQANWIVSLKYWTAAAVSSAVLRGICRVSRTVMRFLNSSKLVCRLHRLGVGSRRRACGEIVTKIGEWSEERSKHDCTSAKSWGIPLVTQESTKSGNLFMSVGQ